MGHNKGGRPKMLEDSTTLTVTVARRHKEAVQQAALLQGMSMAECVRWMIEAMLPESRGEEGKADE